MTASITDLARYKARSDGERLAAQLSQFATWPTFDDANNLGVELVDITPPGLIGFTTASGDVVYPTDTGWHTLGGAAPGTTVTSGTFTRTHTPGVDPSARIHPDAVIDPTARIEAGVVIGPHVVIGAHAHVGRDSHVSRYSYINAGAFIGAASIIRSAVHIGEGAVIGAGSDLGSCSHVTAGVRTPQRHRLDANEHATPTSTQPATRPSRRPVNRYAATQLAQRIERLLTLDRD